MSILIDNCLCSILWSLYDESNVKLGLGVFEGGKAYGNVEF